MRLYDEQRPATLQDVSYLRRALKRELEGLRVPFDLANDVLLAVAEDADLLALDRLAVETAALQTKPACAG